MRLINLAIKHLTLKPVFGIARVLLKSIIIILSLTTPQVERKR